MRAEYHPTQYDVIPKVRLNPSLWDTHDIWFCLEPPEEGQPIEWFHHPVQRDGMVGEYIERGSAKYERNGIDFRKAALKLLRKGEMPFDPSP